MASQRKIIRETAVSALGKGGKYQFVRQIAEGGMARVFLSLYQHPSGAINPAVVKLIHEDLCQDYQFQKLFAQEARLALSLTHPNLVFTFDYGSVSNSLYIAMEVIDGITLKELLNYLKINNLGPLSKYSGLLLIRDIIKGLSYAHNKKDTSGAPINIVHKDLSPDNIMVTLDGCGKVMDFGLAVQNLNQDKNIVGKVLYSAPEVLKQEVVSQQSDIFSLGIIMVEILSNHHPFGFGKEIMSTMQNIIAGRLPDLEKEPFNLSKDLAALCFSCLYGKTEERVSNISSLIPVIDEIIKTTQFEVNTENDLIFLLKKTGGIEKSWISQLWNSEGGTLQEIPGNAPNLNREATLVTRVHQQKKSLSTPIMFLAVMVLILGFLIWIFMKV